MHAGLATLLNQSVTIYPLTSYGSDGSASYGTGVVSSARVVYHNRKVVDRDGVECVSNATVYLDGNVTVSTESKIKLPDGSEPRIISVDDFPGPTGATYYRAVFV